MPRAQRTLLSIAFHCENWPFIPSQVFFTINQLLIQEMALLLTHDSLISLEIASKGLCWMLFQNISTESLGHHTP